MSESLMWFAAGVWSTLAVYWLGKGCATLTDGRRCWKRRCWRKGTFESHEITEQGSVQITTVTDRRCERHVPESWETA